MGRLSGRVAVVTGASQGIGFGIAEAMAAEGAALVISSRRQEAIDAAAQRLTAKGAKVVAVQSDSSKRDDANRTIAAAVENFGGVDILVNNAQASMHMNVEDITDEAIALTFGSGYNGTLYHMQAAFPHLQKKGGSIINLGSRQGIYGQPHDGPYGANKEAIRALSRTAAREWGKHQIRVNVICPAGLSPAAEAFLAADPERAEMYYKEMPLGRFGRLVEDIAPVAIFLASEDGQYVTGQTINADGGQVML